jgi:hypothetical protein
MFLFTSLPASEPAAAGGGNAVTSAIKDAADRSGISFDYLVKTATRESRLDPAAKARDSSASGLFQFLEQTWLGLIKSDGARLGMATEAAQIVPDRNGRLTIADPALKARVLAQRDDPRIASAAAGVFTAQNREALSGALGRAPTEGELYIAHFLGAGGAAQLVKLAAIKPGANAATYFSEAASANRSIFYERSGRPRSAVEVYHALIAAHESARPPAAPVQVAAAIAAPEGASDAPAGKPLFGLFRSMPDGAASGIRNAWSGLAWKADHAGASRKSFFPYGQDAIAVAAATASGMTPSGADPVTPAILARVPKAQQADAAVPLPPARPQFADGIGARHSMAAPLDLLSFTRTKG